MTDDDIALETYVERINRVFEDELTDDDGDDYEIALSEWNAPDTSYRLRVRPADLETGSWEADLGPAFKDPDKLRAFLRGLELGGDGTVARKASK